MAQNCKLVLSGLAYNSVSLLRPQGWGAELTVSAEPLCRCHARGIFERGEQKSRARVSVVLLCVSPCSHSGIGGCWQRQEAQGQAELCFSS